MNKPTVLIVDDEPKLLDGLLLLLKNKFHILTAENGAKGLSSFKANPAISIILLDLDMPVMNGVAALEKIREISNEVKVIIMTGKSTHDWAKKCASLNVQGYAEKPFDIKKLIDDMKMLMRIDNFEVLKKLWKEDYEMVWNSCSHIVKNTLYYMENNFHTGFNVKELADRIGVSHEHLGRVFYKECKLHLVEYINMLRIEKSKKLLSVIPVISIGKVAKSIGINDLNQFCKLFKKHTEQSPSQFRKTIIN